MQKHILWWIRLLKIKFKRIRTFGRRSISCSTQIFLIKITPNLSSSTHNRSMPLHIMITIKMTVNIVSMRIIRGNGQMIFSMFWLMGKRMIRWWEILKTIKKMRIKSNKRSGICNKNRKRNQGIMINKWLMSNNLNITKSKMGLQDRE